VPHPAYFVLALAFVSAAAAGIVVRDADDAPALTTVEGIVTHVAWNPHFEVAVAYELRNESANATYSVEFGPPWWWAEVGLPEIQVNDTLKVEGVLHEENHIDAYTIWVDGGDAFVLREAGKPDWAQVASGRSEDA